MERAANENEETNERCARGARFGLDQPADRKSCREFAWAALMLLTDERTRHTRSMAVVRELFQLRRCSQTLPRMQPVVARYVAYLGGPHSDAVEAIYTGAPASGATAQVIDQAVAHYAEFTRRRLVASLSARQRAKYVRYWLRRNTR